VTAAAGSRARGDLAFEAAILDLDGVLTRTARLHAAAWKEVFDAFLAARAAAAPGEPPRPFDERADYLRHVDGKPRRDGVRDFLAARGIALAEGTPDDPPGAPTVGGLARRKNEIFRRLLDERGVEVDAGAVALVRELRARGLRTGLASSSRNARPVIERASLAGLFDAVVAGDEAEALGLRGKPHPDILAACAGRLAADPGRTAVLEDAAAGVAAARAGGFGVVVGVDRGGNRPALREAGADLVVRDLGALGLETLDAWFRGRADARPCALARSSGLDERLARGRPAVFLDYDGTLTPIVARPDLAVLDDGPRAVLAALARACPTVIVSGRGREDVARLVALEELYYAGSHGFDIAGPPGSAIRHEVDPGLAPAVAAAARELEARVGGIEGALVEDKRFSVAVHYRLVREEDGPRVEAAVDAVLSGAPRLRKAHGKKVFELRPAIDWDKGRALLFLIEALGLDSPDLVPVYIGDDVTDEDAFRAIAGRGAGILVAETPRPTAAAYSVADPDEVREVLCRILEIARARARGGAGEVAGGSGGGRP